MPDPSHLLAFVLAALVLTLSPGPDNLLVLSLGVSRGRRAGMVFGLGCALGCLSHTLLAALGISALVAASDWGFTALRLAGGAYDGLLGVVCGLGSGMPQRPEVRVSIPGGTAIVIDLRTQPAVQAKVIDQVAA